MGGCLFNALCLLANPCSWKKLIVDRVLISNNTHNKSLTAVNSIHSYSIECLLRTSTTKCIKFGSAERALSCLSIHCCPPTSRPSGRLVVVSVQLCNFGLDNEILLARGWIACFLPRLVSQRRALPGINLHDVMTSTSFHMPSPHSSPLSTEYPHPGCHAPPRGTNTPAAVARNKRRSLGHCRRQVVPA